MTERIDLVYEICDPSGVRKGLLDNDIDPYLGTYQYQSSIDFPFLF
jgi:hypothetical protein